MDIVPGALNLAVPHQYQRERSIFRGMLKSCARCGQVVRRSIARWSNSSLKKIIRFQALRLYGAHEALCAGAFKFGIAVGGE